MASEIAIFFPCPKRLWKSKYLFNSNKLSTQLSMFYQPLNLLITLSKNYQLKFASNFQILFQQKSRIQILGNFQSFNIKIIN
uniref:Transmembrane protein n=1 Tax=Meloidogyne incognita TaxID=6306 RepID=A0A914KVZ1_MELIC